MRLSVPPPSVAAAVHRLGLKSAGSLDVLNGVDLLTPDGRMTALRLLESKKPLFLMSSPPCTMYSELTRLWNAKKMDKKVRKLRQKEADLMLKFGVEMCAIQHKAGRLYCHEHPHKASSWKSSLVPLLHLVSSDPVQ